MKFNFHFGKKDPSFTKRVATALFFVSAVPFLAKTLRLKEQSLYDFIDEIVRRHFPESVMNEYILKTDKMLNRRIERDVDAAIEEFTENVPSVTITEPIFTEEQPDGSEAQQLLGGAMSLSSPWDTTEDTDGNQNEKL